MSQERELLKGTTPTLILAVLSDAPRHGYAVAREIERRSESVLSLGEGSLYPALHALERNGLIEGTWEPQAVGAPRKVYAITEAGSAELARRTITWRSFVAAIDTILQKAPDVQPI